MGGLEKGNRDKGVVENINRRMGGLEIGNRLLLMPF